MGEGEGSEGEGGEAWDTNGGGGSGWVGVGGRYIMDLVPLTSSRYTGKK